MLLLYGDTLELELRVVVLNMCGRMGWNRIVRERRERESVWMDGWMDE